MLRNLLICLAFLISGNIYAQYPTGQAYIERYKSLPSKNRSVRAYQQVSSSGRQFSNRVQAQASWLKKQITISESNAAPTGMVTAMALKMMNVDFCFLKRKVASENIIMLKNPSLIIPNLSADQTDPTSHCSTLTQRITKPGLMVSRKQDMPLLLTTLKNS